MNSQENEPSMPIYKQSTFCHSCISLAYTVACWLKSLALFRENSNGEQQKSRMQHCPARPIENESYYYQICLIMEQNYQYSGSRVNSSLWRPLLLLLSLLQQPFLSLAVLVPGEDPSHAHPGTR